MVQQPTGHSAALRPCGSAWTPHHATFQLDSVCANTSTALLVKYNHSKQIERS
jgi:hypothetical protein